MVREISRLGVALGQGQVSDISWSSSFFGVTAKKGYQAAPCDEHCGAYLLLRWNISDAIQRRKGRREPDTTAT